MTSCCYLNHLCNLFYFSHYTLYFLSLRFFGLLSSSLLLFPQRFGLLQVFVELENLHSIEHQWIALTFKPIVTWKASQLKHVYSMWIGSLHKNGPIQLICMSGIHSSIYPQQNYLEQSNFELRHLLKPVLIPFAMTGYKW